MYLSVVFEVPKFATRPVEPIFIIPVERMIEKGVSIKAPASEYRLINKSAPAFEPDSVPETSKFILEPAVRL